MPKIGQMPKIVPKMAEFGQNKNNLHMTLNIKTGFKKSKLDDSDNLGQNWTNARNWPQKGQFWQKILIFWYITSNLILFLIKIGRF